MTGKNVLFIISDRDWRRAIRESKKISKFRFQMVSDCEHAIAFIIDPMNKWVLIATQEMTDELRETIRRIDPSLPIVNITRSASSVSAVSAIGELEALLASILDK